MADDTATPAAPPPDIPLPPPPASRAARWETVRFVVLFLVVFGALYGTLSYVPWARANIVEPWTRAVAAMSTWAMQLFDPRIMRQGTLILGPRFAISIIDGCNGITPLCLLCAGITAFPTDWRARLIGFGVGVPAVMFVNQVRVLALYYLGAFFPEWFDRSHLYVAQAFVVLLTGGVWLWWLGRWATRVRPAANP